MLVQIQIAKKRENIPSNLIVPQFPNKISHWVDVCVWKVYEYKKKWICFLFVCLNVIDNTDMIVNWNRLVLAKSVQNDFICLFRSFTCSLALFSGIHHCLLEWFALKVQFHIYYYSMICVEMLSIVCWIVTKFLYQNVLICLILMYRNAYSIKWDPQCMVFFLHYSIESTINTHARTQHTYTNTLWEEKKKYDCEPYK